MSADEQAVGRAMREVCEQAGRTAIVATLGLALLAGCGGSATKSDPGPPTFSPKQAAIAINALEATNLSPVGVAAGSETFGAVSGWTPDGKYASATRAPSGGPLGEALNANVEAHFAIEDDFDDPTYFENIPTVACGRSVSLTSVTGGGRSKKADALQSKIVADLADRCASDSLTGKELTEVLENYGFSVQLMVAGTSNVSSPHVAIHAEPNAADAADHVAAFSEAPMPGTSVGAVGSLVVRSRGPRSGTEFTEAKAEFDAAMSALRAGA